MSKKILIVDDEKDLRDALGEALEHAGYQTLSASDGEEGVTKALEEKPDLILLDIMMPNMNGHEALARIRKDAWGKDAKVLLLTASDDPADVVNVVQNEGTDYLVKSNWSLEDVVKRVKQSLLGYD